MNKLSITKIDKTTEFYLYLSALLFSIVCIISSIVIIVKINDTSKDPKEEINNLKKTIETLFWIFAIFFFFFVIPVVPLISIFIYSKAFDKNAKKSLSKFGTAIIENKLFCSLIAILSLTLLVLFWISKDIVNDDNIEDETKGDRISNYGIALLSIGLVILTITLPKLWKLFPEYKEEMKKKALGKEAKEFQDRILRQQKEKQDKLLRETKEKQIKEAKDAFNREQATEAKAEAAKASKSKEAKARLRKIAQKLPFALRKSSEKAEQPEQEPSEPEQE